MRGAARSTDDVVRVEEVLLVNRMSIGIGQRGSCSPSRRDGHDNRLRMMISVSV
jgi:hypothetical protein